GRRALAIANERWQESRWFVHADLPQAARGLADCARPYLVLGRFALKPLRRIASLEIFKALRQDGWRPEWSSPANSVRKRWLRYRPQCRRFISPQPSSAPSS